MKTIRLLSKPVAPPWNDATKNIARSLLEAAQHHEYRFWGTADSRVLETDRVRCDAIYEAGGRFEPGIRQNLRPLVRLLRPEPSVDVYHYLFTPNPRTSAVLKAVATWKRRPTVHTLCSAPRSTDHARWLFSDTVVAVSEATGQWLRDNGVHRVAVIPPGVADVHVSDSRITSTQQRLESAGRPVVLFSGDYEYSQAHDVILDAVPAWVRVIPDVLVIFACRHKTPAAKLIEAEVAARVRSEGLADHVRLLAQVDDVAALIAAADVVIFPVQSMHHKMDIPLTLLEAMLLRKPVVVTSLPPLRELRPELCGAVVPPGDAEALATAVRRLLTSPSLREQVGEAGRDLVLTRFSQSQMANAYEALYESL